MIKPFLDYTKNRILRSIIGGKSMSTYQSLLKRGESFQFQNKSHQTFSQRFYRVYNARPTTLTTKIQQKFNNPDSIVYSILGLNALVFAGISLSTLERDQRKLYKIRRWLYENIYLSLNNIQQHRYWTLISHSFAHENTWHFVANAVTLYFFAFPVLHSLGTKRFMALYFGSGLSAAGLYLGFNYNAPKTLGLNAQYNTTLGASGHTMGLLTYFALKYPFEQIILFIFPMPAILLVGGYIIYDLFSLNSKEKTWMGLRVNHIGHLGGALAGAAMFLYTRRIPPNMRNNIRWRGRA